MLSIISPAKRLDGKAKLDFPYSPPPLLNHTKELIGILKSTNPAQLQKLMKISPKLADLNFQRFGEFDLEHNLDNSTQSIFFFKGDVYRGLEVDTLQKDEILFLNEHLRILSGLYGVLKPLAIIQAYRLEMGTNLINKRGKDLYDFWGDLITEQINQAIAKSESNILINLASDEYFKSIKTEKIDANIIKIVFKEFRDDKLKFITFNAKRARGLMVRYIAKNKINTPEELKGFDYENYYFDHEHSTENEYWFIR